MPQKMTYTQTGGAGSYIDLDASYIPNYTTHQIQVTGVTTTASVSAKGPADQYTTVKTLSNNDILQIDGLYDAFRVYWSDSSGGSVSIRSYNLDEIDGG
tara:strand:- start:50 stop:346 length:297 start_codon:yes stop_codon:yes gene_type:complete